MFSAAAFALMGVLLYTTVNEAPQRVNVVKPEAQAARESTEAPLVVDVGRIEVDQEAPTPVTVPDSPSRDQDCGVRVAVLEARIVELERKLTLASPHESDTTVGRWYAMMRPEDRPTERELQIMTDYLAPYPVRLQPEEGLWILERTRKDDWSDWGGSIDEVLIAYLGARRIANEVPPDALAELRSEWSSEGYFD